MKRALRLSGFIQGLSSTCFLQNKKMACLKLLLATLPVLFCGSLAFAQSSTPLWAATPSDLNTTLTRPFDFAGLVNAPSTGLESSDGSEEVPAAEIGRVSVNPASHAAFTGRNSRLTSPGTGFLLEAAAAKLAPAAPSMAGQLSGFPVGPFCQGQSFSLNYQYNIGDVSAGNIYTIELSNDNFITQKIAIGRLVSSNLGGSIQVTIPFNAARDNDYQIRIVASTGPTSINYGPYTINGGRDLGLVSDVNACLGLNGTFASGTFATSTGATSPPATISYLWKKVCTTPANGVFTNSKSGLDPMGTSAVNLYYANSKLYVATAKGLGVSIDNGATFTLPVSVSGDVINDVFANGNGIYLATQNGVRINTDPSLDGSAGTFTTAIGNAVTAIYARGMDVYAASSGGLYASSDDGVTFNLYTTAEGLGSNSVTDVFVGSDGTVYAATTMGISILYPGETSFVTTNLLTHPMSGLLSNNINSVYVSANGVIYLGTNKGVSVSTDGGTTFTTTTAGLGDNAVGDIFVDETNNIIYAATIKGLSMMHVGANKFTNFNTRQGLGADFIASLAVNAGTVFAGNGNGVSKGNIATATTTMDASNALNPNDAASYDITGLGYADANCRFFARVTVDGCISYTNIASLNDIPPQISVISPTASTTKCDNQDGSFTLTGLYPNVSYQVQYSGGSGFPASGTNLIANASGQIVVNFLAPGTYTNVHVRSTVAPNCESNKLTVVISPPDEPLPPVPDMLSVTPVCAGTNVTVPMPDLTPTPLLQYRWYTNMAAGDLADPGTSIDDYVITAPGSSGSLWVRIRNTATNCLSDSVKVMYTVNPGVTISHDKTEPTTAGGTDGTITITVSPAGTYTIASSLGPIPQTGNTFTYTGLPVGNYTNFQVSDPATNCQSNIIASCPLLGPPPPDVISTQNLLTTVCGIPGTAGGYLQKVTDPSHANVISTPIDETAGMIAVGRIRQTTATPTGFADENEKVEMRGWVQFNISRIPVNATIKRVEFTPTSAVGGFQAVNDVTIDASATGDIKFDITQMSDDNYAAPNPLPTDPVSYPSFSDRAFDDQFEVKYNDFVIGSDATGAKVDLGPSAVADVQRRLASTNKMFQLGLTLSGTDFDVPVFQFHGKVFSVSNEQQLCITYELRDYGDLPEPKFATDLAGGLVGPSHKIDSVDLNTDPLVSFRRPAMFIGATPPDAEANGQPNATATGDNAGVADEDIALGWFTNPATNNTWIAGNTVTLTVPTVTNNLPKKAKLVVFVDWNNDGFFENTPVERFDAEVAANGNLPNEATAITNLQFVLPIPIYASGDVGVRIRMTSGEVFDAYGPAPDGEVEDYILEGIRGFDYGDLADGDAGTGPGNYQTIFSFDPNPLNIRGPRHLINPNLKIGNTVDSEADGQPQPNAFGDDINGIDDEDGVVQPDSIVRDQPAKFRVFVTNKTGATAYLQGFVDWNNDGSFEDASPNQKSTLVSILAGESGYYDVWFTVPVMPTPLPERVAARFRLSNENSLVTVSTGPLSTTNIEGEVEDTWVSIVGYDWGDLAEPRYITDREGGQAGPSHRITATDHDNDPGTPSIHALYIGGTAPDPELEGQANQFAKGDDNTLPDDEDLSFRNFVHPTTGIPYPLVVTNNIILRVPVVNNYINRAATLWAFIDWNGDGEFDGVTETYQLPVPANPPLDAYTANFNITIPPIAKSDSIGVRIRLTSGNILNAYGQAPDGEVEDFMVELRAADYGDLPDPVAGTADSDFNTLRVHNGPRHGVPITPLVYMGTRIDTEADGLPTLRSVGDDNNPVPDDEDGIIFLGPLVPGSNAQLSFTGTNNELIPATLHMWADWNNDGTLEYVTSSVVAPSTTVNARVITFAVPNTATFAGGKVYFRFRFTTDAPFNAAPSPMGTAVDGEVEDYFLPIFKMGNLVWEDRNHNGLQDNDEINLGIQGVRVVLRFGGINPVTGAYDEVTQNTITNPNTPNIDLGAVRDSILQTYTDEKGLYCFNGLIEGRYQIIALDTFGLTPTRFDHIKNVTEEDLDSDGNPLKNPWDYVSGDRRQSKSQIVTLKVDQIGTDEEGILDQGNPQLLDPNAVGVFPDDRVEQRIDFGYVGLDFGDLDSSLVHDPSISHFNTEEDGIGGHPEGPKHIVTPDLRLGNCQDVEWQGQPDPDAGANFKPVPVVLGGGDDPIADFSNYPGAIGNPTLQYDPSQGRRWPFHLDVPNVCGDDEDGIRFLTPMVPGYDAILSVKYNAKINLDGPDAYLHAWFDWNGNGKFDDGAGKIDANEHIIFYKRDGVEVSNMLEPNTQAVKLEMSYLTSDKDSLTLTFKVPANVKYNKGNILSRFRISFDPHLGPNGILIPNPTLPPNQNFPDPQPGAGTSMVPGGVIPYGEVEDYFISLSKVGNTVFEDRDYDGFQDLLEPGIGGVPITLHFAGADGIPNNNDAYEFTYHDTTYIDRTPTVGPDSTGLYFFCGLIGNVDPSGNTKPVYVITVKDPAGMTSTFNNPDPSDDVCIDDNSNGDDLLIDNRITTDTFSIMDPMMLCLDENAPRNDVGGIGLPLDPGNHLPPDLDVANDDAFNNFPDNQYDETRDFGYTGFDYGDLPIVDTLKGSHYLTLRDSMDAKFSGKFGPRHAIQPRLYLGNGVDGELNGKPDKDAGSKAGGDDDDQGKFKKGKTADDENGVRLLTPLLPGEIAYIKVNFTSQDTINGSYSSKDAYLDAFIDWNGDGIMHPTDDKVTFTHQLNSNAVFSTNSVPVITTLTPSTPTLMVTNTNGVDSTILGFRVPKTAVFDSGTVFMRFRLGWTNYKSSFPNAFLNGLGPDNNIFHKKTSPYVKSFENNLPFNPILAPPNNWTDAADDTGRYPYPQGEVEDYAIPVAKIGNLAWFDHDVFGDQDRNEDVVDSLHLVLIWGGVDNTSGTFDTVGYQTNLSSLGLVNDIRYNFTITPNTNGLYTDPALIKTAISGMPSVNPDSGLYSFRGLIPGIYYVLPRKYFETDSAAFVNAWPKHRVVTLQDNPGVNDSNDSDGLTQGVGGKSRGPGAFVKITDGNNRQPEVCVNDRPLLETGMRDTADLVEKLTPAFFPDNQWDRSVDFGWVDEPNVEASMDIVGVNFPTSQICGNFNVITHFCIKNPQEVPLDSLQMFFDLKDAYGDALYTATKPIVTIVDSAFVTKPVPDVKIRKSSLVNFKTAANAKPKDLLVVNTSYNGTTDTTLLVPTSENANFLLRGDSVLCVQIEFEIDPSKWNASKPWMLSGLVSARAIGFEKSTGNKRPLTDFRYFHPRFGKSIVVYDSTDEFDDPMPMAGLTYPNGGDCILFEGKVVDRGLLGDYKNFPPKVEFISTGKDKYADEDDKAIQNDECWINTKWNSGYKDFTIALDANCQAVVNADLLVPNFIAACGFDKYPMGSYYRVIIQDKWTEETLWASVDRVPFDVNKYLDRKLIYKVRSVANHCNVIWGEIIFTDKIPPMVTCPVVSASSIVNRRVAPKNQSFVPNARLFVCSDIDSIYNVSKSWLDTTYAYYTGIATATDACSVPRLENVKDEIIFLSDCTESAAKAYVYAQIRRTFTFIDRMGNKANCSQLINFIRPTIKLPECKIVVPNDKAKGDMQILPSDLIGKKYNIKESVPYFINGSGDTIYITGKDYCGFAFNYTDESVFVTGQGQCGKKILRTWSIFDWCYGTTVPGGGSYPNYLMFPVDKTCYPDFAAPIWAGNRYTWQQTIIVGDEEKPKIYALDIDRDGKQGTFGFDPTPDPSQKNTPKIETPTYDPDDVLIYSTGPMDCTGNFLFNRSHFKVEEQSDWCYDIRVVERVEILDLDERGTGKFELKVHPFVKVTGSCAAGYTVTGVPMKGDWFVEVRVYDACYQDSTALIPVRIMDLVSPVMKCDDKLNVTLDNLGNGFVSAKDFDEGSWDNCNKLEWVKVRRPVQDACVATFLKFPRVVDANQNGKIDPYDPSKGLVDVNGNGKEDDYDYIDLNSDRRPQLNEYFTIGEYFTKNQPAAGNGSGMIMTPLMDTVPFFCCDGGSLMVELWGRDKFLNYNYCWNNVQLEDKTPIECVAPWEETVYCDDKRLAFIDDLKLSAKAFGDVVIARGAICIIADTAYTTVKKLKCGAGTIERIWTLTKQTAHGPVVTTCKQIIRVLPLREYNIRLPKDTDQRDCKQPIVDSATVRELGCDILAVNVSEKRYDASDDECYKIFRTYTIINWCTYNDACGDPMDPSNLLVVNRGTFENYGKSNLYILVRDRDYKVKVNIGADYPQEGRTLPSNTQGIAGVAPYVYSASGNTTVEFKRDGDEEFWISADTIVGNASTLNMGDNDNISGNNSKADFLVNRSMPYCTKPSTSLVPIPAENYVHGFMYTQIIKVYDTVKPTVTGDPAKFCIRDAGDCLADLKMVVTGTDNCTDQVTLQTNMLMVAPLQTTDPGSMILYSTPRWSTKDLGNGKFEINVANLPQGKHDLIVVVRDECGNLSDATRIPFTVEDCKAPAPICIQGLSTELMPDASGTGGMMTVWATDFVASKIYDCNGQGPETNGNGKLVTKYSINRVGSPVVESQTSLLFTCADAGKPIQVELHAWDNAGNHDFCVTFIDIQDNRKVCTPGNANAGVISGLVATDESEPVAGVMINVSGAATLNQPTANAGVFAFGNLVKGSDFTVSAQLDKDHLNGVSTFDLVQIQKHILGVKPLEGPYRQIAADVNNSKSISTLDMIQIRKLILNIDERFKSVPSWKFVDASYKFADAQNPFTAEFPEVVNVNDLAGNVRADFMAIKMGDVNGNAAPSSGIASTEIRSDRQFLLAAEDVAMKAEGHYQVAIRAKDLRNIQGYQFTLNYDLNALELEGIEYGVAKADNFGIFKNRGAITTSWNLSSSLGAAGNEVLFTLKLKARTAVKLSEVLNISSQLTPAEAYDTQNEAIGVKLSFGAISGQDFAVLRQNTPNPFHDETLVGFYLPKAAKAVLTIRDTKGSLVYRTEGNFVKGENKVILKQADLKASGVLYYTLETADFTDTKKMILLNR